MPKRDRRGISERIEAERGGVKTEREVNISWQAQRFDDVFLHFPALLLPSWSFFLLAGAVFWDTGMSKRVGVKTEREVNISWQAQRFDDIFLHFPALLLPSWSFFLLAGAVFWDTGMSKRVGVKTERGVHFLWQAQDCGSVTCKEMVRYYFTFYVYVTGGALWEGRTRMRGVNAECVVHFLWRAQHCMAPSYALLFTCVAL